MRFWTNSSFKSFDLNTSFEKIKDSVNYTGNSIIDYGENYFKKGMPARYLVIIYAKDSFELNNSLKKVVSVPIFFDEKRDKEFLSVISEKNKKDFGDL